MFILKKLFSRMFFPVPLCLEIILAGVVLIFLRRDRAGRLLLLLGFSLLLVFSMDPAADLALHRLEGAFKPLPAAQVPRDLDFIVVLGSGHDSKPGFPANSRASSTTVARVVEGLRIKRYAPDAEVVFTGGRIYDPQTNARVMAGVARELGLKRSRIVLEEKSLDTADHVRYLKPLLENKKFVLVTSASHMPRAAALFRAGGLDPIPSSTDYRSLHTDYSPWDYIPSANALEKTRRFFYECMGLAWAWTRGQI